MNYEESDDRDDYEKENVKKEQGEQNDPVLLLTLISNDAELANRHLRRVLEKLTKIIDKFKKSLAKQSEIEKRLTSCNLKLWNTK